MIPKVSLEIPNTMIPNGSYLTWNQIETYGYATNAYSWWDGNGPTFGAFYLNIGSQSTVWGNTNGELYDS